MSLATIDEALKRIRRGEMVLVVDDEDRENEGDLVLAADLVTPDAINFMARHGRGLICLSLTEERVAALGLSMMTPAAVYRLWDKGDLVDPAGVPRRDDDIHLPTAALRASEPEEPNRARHLLAVALGLLAGIEVDLMLAIDAAAEQQQMCLGRAAKRRWTGSPSRLRRRTFRPRGEQ